MEWRFLHSHVPETNGKISCAYCATAALVAATGAVSQRRLNCEASTPDGCMQLQLLLLIPLFMIIVADRAGRYSADRV
jgi:hypothetical protein